MKILNLLLLSSLLIFSIACEKDCDPGNLEQAIIGQWTLSDSSETYGVLEFRSDGTVLDPDYILFADENTPITYTTNANESFTIFLTFFDDPEEIEFEVTNYTCEIIKTETSGVEIKLDKK